MGGPMAANLLRAGWSCSVHDLRREAAQELEALEASWAPTAAEAAIGADVVFTMLPGPNQVQDVMIGEGAVIASISPESIWCDLSTSSAAAAWWNRFFAGPWPPMVLKSASYPLSPSTKISPRHHSASLRRLRNPRISLVARTPDPALKQELLDKVVGYLAVHGIGMLSLGPMAEALGGWCLLGVY